MIFASSGPLGRPLGDLLGRLGGLLDSLGLILGQSRAVMGRFGGLEARFLAIRGRLRAILEGPRRPSRAPGPPELPFAVGVAAPGPRGRSTVIYRS